ncbi:MAG: hypothetical protein DHS20C14_07080 [Phycisphaeraceae bacterium]|nr:MAG: hypothetical protein DHS20C14_07080 [Phycisphaeraceae bacterium]
MTRNAKISALLAAVGIASGAQAELVYGTTENNTLLSWDSAAPTTLLSGVAISGLGNNEAIRGIDFRPANGQLYAMGSFNNLYTLNRTTGAATLVGNFGGTPLNGSSFGFDFNPVIDRIRVVSDADQNLVLNPNDGTGTPVTSLFYGSGDANEGTNPNVNGSAYTNSFAGATTTQLYGIDTGLDVLVRQANSAGTLETVGFLGQDLTDVVGFDISASSGIAYATVRDTALSRSTFWTIDLNTGLATMIGEIGGGALVTTTAVVPAPSGVACLAMSAALVGARRRRR